MLVIITIMVLFVLFFAGLPTHRYSRHWGFGPSGIAGLLILMAALLMLTGIIR